ncbi:Apoptosis facilitator Bcl-2-like 14 [Podiceps cristatus]|uniref:Apoptosis facilitator Bcl-2-like 14 n=1 Tax=Podiceps cristatus TaxID=345573 RepID=A0A094KH65_PODCR|nr:Apoptosis facilitator Bcl-2-like 14 [Podiceps cristatus]
MEEIPLEDDERDSIEYKILMAYAQRRLSASKYGKLLKKEANVQKSSSFIRRKVKTDHQRDKDGPSRRIVFQGGTMQQQSKTQSKPKHMPGYCLPFFCGRAEREKTTTLSLSQHHTAHLFDSEEQSEVFQEGNSQHQINVSFKIMTYHAPFQEQDNSGAADGSEGKEHDEERIIQTIVSLLRQSGDRLEEKIKKDKSLYQHFTDMLSYDFFKRITDLFLEDVSADSTSEPGGQVQRMKVAFTMEVATRLTAVDNHPMNLVLGFGIKYLREHFRPWIQDQGGWEKALTSLDQEEVE